MKTAVLITGHMRTFPVCVHTLRWQVLRHYQRAGELSFYVSTVRDEQADSWKLLEQLFPKSPVYIDVVDKQPDIPEPHEPVRFEPYARSVPMQAVLRQLWQLNECWKLYRRSGETGHQVFIRTRPDLFFHDFTPPAAPSYDEAHTPWWGRFGGVNDRFAVLGAAAAEMYHTTFAEMQNLLFKGAPIHPESLVEAAMVESGCRVRQDLRVTFSTLRMNGEIRQPEIAPWDLAEAAL